MPIGPEPNDSPDVIAATLGLTNAAIERTSAPVTKTADQILQTNYKEDRWKKPIRLGSTKYELPEERDPTKRDWTEADFQRELKRWAMANGTTSAVIEAKVSTSDSLPFDRLEPHQRKFLLDASERKAYYHPSDFANSIGFRAKLPCDAIFLAGVKSFVAVMYHVKEKGNKTFYLVPIARWVEEEKGERRSLTEERSAIIGTKCQL